jgi:hypothetical protein
LDGDNSDGSDFDLAGEDGTHTHTHTHTYIHTHTHTTAYTGDRGGGQHVANSNDFDLDGEKSDFDLAGDADNGGHKGKDDSDFDLAASGEYMSGNEKGNKPDTNVSMGRQSFVKDVRRQRAALDEREARERAREEEELAALDLTLSALNTQQTHLVRVAVEAKPATRVETPPFLESASVLESVPVLKAAPVHESLLDSPEAPDTNVETAQHSSATPKVKEVEAEPKVVPQVGHENEAVIVSQVEPAPIVEKLVPEIVVKAVVPGPDAVVKEVDLSDIRQRADIAKEQRQTRREKRNAAQGKTISSAKAEAPPPADRSLESRKRVEIDRARREHQNEEAQEVERQEELAERQQRKQALDAHAILARGKIEALEQMRLKTAAQQEANREKQALRAQELEDQRTAKESEVARLKAAKLESDRAFQQQALDTMSASQSARAITDRKQDAAELAAKSEEARVRKVATKTARVEMEAAEARNVQAVAAQEAEVRRQRQESITRCQASTKTNLRKADLNRQRMQVKEMAAHGTKRPSFSVAPYARSLGRNDIGDI